MSYAVSGSDEIIIPLDKAKTGALAARLSIVLALIVASTIVLSGTHDAARRALYMTMGVALIVLCGVILLLAVGRLLNPAPALVISARGITDNVMAGSKSFVSWDEIASVHIGTFSGRRFLFIVAKDVPGFIARQPAWKRPAMRADMNQLGTPISVSDALIPMPLEELQSRVIAHLQAAVPEPPRR